MRNILRKNLLFFITLIIVNIYFFDGIYLHKSYIALNYERALLGNTQYQGDGLKFLNLSQRGSEESWIDIGGAAFQTNVMPQVTKNSNSFIWSNAIATGNNLLYDFTFQPFSTTNLAASLLFPNLNTLNWIFISLVLIATYYLLLILRKFFKLSIAASTLGGVIFIGNGFLSSSWSNHVALPYLFCPIYMYYLYGFIFKEKYKLICPIVGVIFLLNTFMPTLILMLVASFVIYLQLTYQSKILSLTHFILRYIKITLLILLLSAFVYVPAFIIANKSGSVSSYLLEHPYYHLPLRGAFLLLSPNLFLYNFNSLYITAYDWWVEGQFAVPYIGVIACFLFISSIFIISKKNIILLIAIIIFLLRIFSNILEPLFTLPLLQSISVPYFFSIIVYLSVFLIAINFDEILKNDPYINKKLSLLIFVILIYYFNSVNIDFDLSRINNFYFSFSLLTIFILIMNTSWRYKAYAVLILVFIELFMSQNFNKHDLRNLDEYSLPPTLKFIVSDSDKNFRILNTSFNALPPSVDAALGINSVQSFGHLSVDKSYLKIFSDGVGSDTRDYPIIGFTSCTNLNFNKDYYNNLSIKYIITDNGECKNIVENHFNLLMKDDDFSIFINEGALPISSINDNSCAIDHKKSLLSQTFKFTNCFGEFKTNINFDSYFKYYLDDKEVLPNRVDNFLAFPISGNLNLSVVYQYWPAYIGALISLFGILIIFLNKYYLRIKAYIFL